MQVSSSNNLTSTRETMTTPKNHPDILLSKLFSESVMNKSLCSSCKMYICFTLIYRLYQHSRAVEGYVPCHLVADSYHQKAEHVLCQSDITCKWPLFFMTFSSIMWQSVRCGETADFTSVGSSWEHVAVNCALYENRRLKVTYAFCVFDPIEAIWSNWPYRPIFFCYQE